MKKLPSIDKARPGGHNDFARRSVGSKQTTVEIYERLLGVTPEQVRDQEERVHERAGALADLSYADMQTTDPKVEGDTVRLVSHDSEDADQDKIHRQAASLALRRTQ